VSDQNEYVRVMARRSLLQTARVARGLTQEAVAPHAGTSQPTLSAYERGMKSPTLAVVERILHTLDYEIGLQPRATFREVRVGRRTFLVPDQLWRVDPPDCFAPLTIDDDGRRRDVQLRHREGRVEAYAWLLTHGDETQLFEHVDGALLVDVWPDVVPLLPAQLRKLWGALVFHAAEGWADDYLIASLRTARPPKVSARARARAIKRLAEYGLSVDEIRAVLRRQ